ncbi:hypothetical protein OS493_026726 [Desmophyllum pertusum]|uniref:Ubiquitin-like domain-containing protein n=1 Tax=Desmophyllum pertusum TaxID=174260 RepID=A0A9W9ZYJ3_9CNID|nr:hypothetical protein OS493_026726 [Desmophyllum pertusum]
MQENQETDKYLHKISLTDFETATVGDLKRVISKKWKTGISYLMYGGKVLQEEKTISSYALNENEVIQVLNAEEELKIEPVGKDPVTMMVDPRSVSVEAVKDFIANKINIQVDEQLHVLRFKEQDVDVDSKSLTRMLIKSKQVPVLKVVTDTNINVKVLSANGKEEKVEINLLATYDDLKKNWRKETFVIPMPH